GPLPPGVVRSAPPPRAAGGADRGPSAGGGGAPARPSAGGAAAPPRSRPAGGGDQPPGIAPGDPSVDAPRVDAAGAPGVGRPPGGGDQDAGQGTRLTPTAHTRQVQGSLPRSCRMRVSLV